MIKFNLKEKLYDFYISNNNLLEYKEYIILMFINNVLIIMNT